MPTSDEAPVNRFATLHDLEVLEDRITNRLDSTASRGWQLISVVMSGLAVIGTFANHLRIH